MVMCDMWLQVHRAYDLNIWTADGGFEGGSDDADAYDTYVQLRLASDEDETHSTVREERTRIVDNCRNPEYNGEFEFLGERVSQRLQLAVVVTRALEHGRFHDDVMGKASVILDDLARCPNGKVRRGSAYMRACLTCNQPASRRACRYRPLPPSLELLLGGDGSSCSRTGVPVPMEPGVASAGVDQVLAVSEDGVSACGSAGWLDFTQWPEYLRNILLRVWRLRAKHAVPRSPPTLPLLNHAWVSRALCRMSACMQVSGVVPVRLGICFSEAPRSGRRMR